jgi:hypothetical protein
MCSLLPSIRTPVSSTIKGAHPQSAFPGTYRGCFRATWTGNRGSGSLWGSQSWYCERRLPHFSVVGVPLFVTFRLHGSLPRGRAFRPDILTSNGEAFAAMDRLLDTARSVPSRSWLGPLKGFTAHEANRILGSAGSRFWQDRELKPGTDGTLHSTQPCRPSRRYTASKCANIRRPYFASTEVCP